MRSMTDEGYGVSHPPIHAGSIIAGLLRKTPHPTFADAKATFSRKGRRKARAHPQFTFANHNRTYSSANTGTSMFFFMAQATGCWCSGMK
jgi:hypothetical protein